MTRAMAKVAVETLRPSTELDALLFGEESCFALSLEAQRALRHRLIADAFHAHVERCDSYRAYLERTGHGRLLSTLPELDDIPVYPTQVFKRFAPLSVPTTSIEKWCLSSGTSGTQSRVGRDRLSLERLLGSVRAALPLLTDKYEHEVAVINLGPDRQEAGDLWFSYVMSLVELLYPTRARVKESVFQVDEAIGDIRELLCGSQEVMLIGPPFLVLKLAERLEARGERLQGGDRVFVVTAGGWKRFSGMAIPRPDFRARVTAALGLAHHAQVRDAFNQVELNTVFLECAGHRKHVPPWVHAVTRAPTDLRALAHGQVGLLSFLDASATSFPCFLVSDDVGVVAEGPCECGREGMSIDILRRTRGASQRGCALSIDKTLEGAA